MALRIWLPLNGSLENKGISDYEIRSANITIADDGKIGKCYSFNGSNSYINITNFEIGNNWSYGCWINTPNSDSRGWEIVMILNNSGSDADSQFAFWVHQKENRFESLANTQYVSTIPYTNYYNNWHHFFATFNGALLTTYIDGNVVNTKTITATQYNAVNLTIGARSTNATGTAFANWFQGKLNDIRVYDHCLSPLEVKEISQGLVLHYKLDGFSGGAGENLISNTKTFTSVTGGNTTLTTESYNGAIIRNYNQTVTANKEILYYNNLLYPELGATYTLSFWAKGSGVITTYFYGASGYLQVASVKNSGGYNGTGTDGNNTLTLSSDWKRYWITWTLKTTGDVTIYKHLLFRHIYSSSNATVQIDIAGLKLEKNAVATSWSPTASEMGIDITKVKDSSGYEYNGEIGGTLTPSSDSPRYNICSYFGTNNYIKIPTREVFVRDALTWSAWAYYDDWSTFGGRIASCTESGGHSMGYRNGTTFYTAYVGTGESSNTYKIQSVNVSTLTSGWHMFSFTYDGLVLKSYIDGVEVKSTTCYSTKTSLYYNNSALMFLGAEANTATASDKNFNGKISDFRIYATALSAEDISDLYHTPANIDNLQNIHSFEFEENGIKTSIYQNGVMSTTDEIHESNTELLNNFTSGGYTPAANTQNSCITLGIVDFTKYASNGEDLAVHIECDLEWTAFTAGTGGTFGFWWQGANWQLNGTSGVWQGTNYITQALTAQKTLRNATLATTAGRYHYDTIVTIPASWFQTYNKSNIGFRCDYSDGTGKITVTNFKTTPLQYYNAKIGTDFISANTFIEK